MAGTETGNRGTSLLKGKDALGIGSLCTGTAPGQMDSRGFGWISCFYGEVILMLVLVTYDVNTETAAGRSRLRKVAKCCVAHGQRVQNSVFECSLDEAQFVALRGELEAIIDLNKDSLRFYNLGNKYQSKIIHVGAKKSYDPAAPMIL